MMHHLAGELNQVTILFQPNILKTFSQIWESEYEICDVSVINMKPIRAAHTTMGQKGKVFPKIIIFLKLVL
jgi:hypothetical protein